MRIGIIGCGNMGSAIARGIINKKVLPFNNIIISDRDQRKTSLINREFGAKVMSAEDLVKQADFIIVSVKPQDAKALFKRVVAYLKKGKHLVSIMAGITVRDLEKMTAKDVPITRAMPNLGALTGDSITALTHNAKVKQKATVNRIFSSIGSILDLDEKYMDAVTAVSGSGPAYFYYLAECLARAGKKAGLKQEDAIKLAVAALVGAGSVIDLTGEKPDALRKRITSKKGTTEEALKVMMTKQFENTIEKAVRAAHKRARQISRGK